MILFLIADCYGDLTYCEHNSYQIQYTLTHTTFLQTVIVYSHNLNNHTAVITKYSFLTR